MQTDGRMGMTRLIAALHNFVNATTKVKQDLLLIVVTQCSVMCCCVFV